MPPSTSCSSSPSSAFRSGIGRKEVPNARKTAWLCGTVCVRCYLWLPWGCYWLADAPTDVTGVAAPLWLLLAARAPRSREPVATPCCRSLNTTLIRLNVLAHDAVHLHVRPRADTRARESARVRGIHTHTHTHTHVCLTTPVSRLITPNSCVVRRRLPLIVLSGNAVGPNFLVYASTQVTTRIARMYVVYT